jgi:hypothetical protein
MEFGPNLIQVFVSLALILGCLVALICHFLKGRGEQLRDLALELKARREQEYKLIGVLPARIAQFRKARAMVATGTGAAAESAAVRNNAAQIGTHSEEFLSPEALAALPEPVRALSRAPAPAVRPAPVAARAVAVPNGQKRVSAEAVTVMQRGVMRAAAASAGSRKNWSSLLAAQRNFTVPRPSVAASRATQPPTRPKPSGLFNAVMAAANTSRSGAAQPEPPAPEFESVTGLETGSQAAPALNTLIESRRRISGLVVAIGVDAGGTGLRAARSAIESLLEPGELGCPIGPDEFVLLLPTERGASAQRRLGYIAQQLWDFQLSSLSRFGVQFSWGGLEVRAEPLEEAVASAAERMRDTRRGRQILAARGAAWATGPNR